MSLMPVCFELPRGHAAMHEIGHENEDLEGWGEKKGYSGGC